ncbi:MAG TPA: efflux RND transporter periplasmic adaptor subunit [Verrucomicrobiae bacterium]|nr:efflux RND transporter periplasmic adaptor subunit [Verrucomicrobiae bacterium]
MNQKTKKTLILTAGVIAVIAVILFRSRGQAKTTDDVAQANTPVVPVVKVERTDLSRTVVIPAEFRPHQSVKLHAKVSGYLNQMNVDFGDRVKAGQVLLTIEVPELHDELNNAIAIERHAEADYTNANLICTRMMGVNKEHPNLVAQQDIDTATAKNSAAEAALNAAKADVGKYETLVSYTNIIAPFDGVVTHRYVDPGALVEAGTATANTQPLLEVSDNYHLRLDFPVSVDYVKNIRVGDTIRAKVESFDGKSIIGKITRASWMVNDETRTMTTEIEVDNPTLELVPGMYASVSIPVDVHANTLAVPIEAVPPGETSSVYVVNAENEIEERPVKLGIDTPTQYEVLSGLKEGELVLTGSRSQFRPGQKVEPKIINLLAAQ